MSPEAFRIVSLGIILFGFGIGARAGFWAMGKAIDWWDARKERRRAMMRDVTPR